MATQRDYTNMSQEEHEEVAAGLFVWFRDAQREKITNGILNPSQPCGTQAQKIEDLIWCFFDERRGICGIRVPSSLMTASELVEFVNDEVLPAIAKARPDLLERNWQGEWQVPEPESAYQPDEECSFLPEDDEDDELLC